MPAFDLYEPYPFYTHPRFLPGAKMEDCTTDRVIVGAGSVLVGASVTRSIIGIRSRIGPDVAIERAIMMGADFFETEKDRAQNRAMGQPDVGIGRASRVQNAIIDKNARIGENVEIRNVNNVRELDGDGFHIRDGIVVVPKKGIIRPGTVI